MNYAAPAGQTTIDIESGTFEIVTKKKLSIKPQLSVKKENSRSLLFWKVNSIETSSLQNAIVLKKKIVLLLRLDPDKTSFGAIESQIEKKWISFLTLVRIMTN